MAEIKLKDTGHKVKDNKDRKPVVVPPHLQVPYAPQNIHMKKSDFIASRTKAKEKALKIANFAANLDKEESKEPKE